MIHQPLSVDLTKKEANNCLNLRQQKEVFNRFFFFPNLITVCPCPQRDAHALRDIDHEQMEGCAQHKFSMCASLAEAYSGSKGLEI